MATYLELKTRMGSAAELGMLPGDQLLDPVGVCGTAKEFTRQVTASIDSSRPERRPAMDWYKATAQIAAACAELGFELDYLERRALFDLDEFDVLQSCIDHRPDLIPVCLDALLDVWFTPENWPLGFTENPMLKNPYNIDDVCWPRPARRLSVRLTKLRLARNV